MKKILLLFAVCLFANVLLGSCGQEEQSGLDDCITRGEQTDSTIHITVLIDTTWTETREYEY